MNVRGKRRGTGSRASGVIALTRLRTTVTYLQMLGGQPCSLALPASVRVEILRQPSVQAYRSLYNGVGSDYYWTDRNRLPDDELRQVIQQPTVQISRLLVDGEPAGFSELDWTDAKNIELVYFGLFPKFIGQGLGKCFLQWTLNEAWARSPDRVWVHTCDLDHPAALPNYLKAGFQIYDQQTHEQKV